MPENYSSPNVDLWTPQVLDGVVRALPPTGTFFKDTFFTTVKTEPTINITVDFYKGARRIAPFVSVRNPATPVEKIGYQTNVFQTPLIKIKDVTNADQLDVRLPGETVYSGGTPAERAEYLVADQLRSFNDMIARREEWMCAQAMLTGKIPVKGEGVDYDIDFNFTHMGTAATSWGAADSNPTEDLKNWQLACLKEGFRNPDVCIMEQKAYNAFKTSNFKDNQWNQFHWSNFNYTPTIINPNVQFMGILDDPHLEIYVYNEWYIDEAGKEQQVIPDGTVIIAYTGAQFSMYYGVLTLTDLLTHTLLSYVAPRAARSWVQNDPDQRFLELQSRPLPVPHEVDTWFVGKVLY